MDDLHAWQKDAVRMGDGPCASVEFEERASLPALAEDVLKTYARTRTASLVAKMCIRDRREIEPGDEISEGNVKVVEWASSLMPEDALTSMGDVSGLVATARIPAHTPLAKAHFLRDERAVQVPRGTVAISVASDAEHAVGGSLARGDEVDVYVADASVADRLTRCLLYTSRCV